MSKFISKELQPPLPLTYYSVQPNSAEGKIRNRLTSCKTFSGRASEIVTDLHAILDPSVAKSSSLTVHHTAVEEDDSEDQGDEDEFFDQGEFSDDQVDDDANGWESGSVYSEYEGPSIGVPMTLASTGSDSNSESNSGRDQSLLRQKARSKVELGSESISGDSDGDSAPDSSLESDSDVSLPSPLVQRKASKPSGGTGTSTFLPSLSVGYIPGTGDSDPEDELEAVEGKDGRNNRRGQRARRA